MRVRCFIIKLAVLLLCNNVYASEDVLNINITLQNHMFNPSEIHVPTGKKVILSIENLDSTIEEFDSPALRREKLLKSKSVTRIIIAPLVAGSYDFVGEFHAETAKGTIIAEE